MERYLTLSEIKRYPTHKKFKKISYGGSKVFIKENIKNKYGKIIECEYYFHNGIWHISSIERKRIQNQYVVRKEIYKRKYLLQSEMTKKPISLTLDRNLYAKIYENYEDADVLGYYKKNSPEYVRVKNILSNIKENSFVYDVGCNSGGIGHLLIRKRNCTVYGSEICLELAKRAKQKGLNVFIGWAEHTPYKDEFFDYAIMTFILEHVLDPQLLMKETIRVLKKHGIIIGHVPTAFGDWGKQTIGRHPEHLRAYTRKDLKKLLQESGLYDIQIKRIFLIGRTVADYYFFMGQK